MSNANTNIKVLLVRHGEREDEAAHCEYWDRQEFLWKSTRKTLSRENAKNSLSGAIKKKLVKLEPYPLVDRLDPLLTAEGHKQAQASFRVITEALPTNSRVAVFSSPLRRAIGTSLMLGTIPFRKDIQWTSPTDNLSEDTPGVVSVPVDDSSFSGGGDDQEDPDLIPITVLNGLGDFASRVNKIGGARVLVPNNLIRCGTVSKNDGSEDSPFVRGIKNMPILSCEPYRNTSKVQFWAPDGSCMSATIDPVAMPYHAETFQQKQHEKNKQDAFFKKARERSQKIPFLNNHTPPPPDPIEAINESIRITAARGCDTCIIVTHREAIRDLKDFCNHHLRCSLPYCAIGTFGATLDKGCGGAKPNVCYNFWKCCPYSEFCTQCIPKPLPWLWDCVLLMTTAFGNGEAKCIGRIRNDSWDFSFPSQVWLDTVDKIPPRDQLRSISATIANESDYDVLTRSYVQPLSVQGKRLYFDSMVCFDTSVTGTSPSKFRFWISSRSMTGTNIGLYYMQRGKREAHTA